MRLVITDIFYKNKNLTAAVIFDDNRKVENLYLYDNDNESIVRNIYAARVENIDPKIGVFLNLYGRTKAFLRYDTDFAGEEPEKLFYIQKNSKKPGLKVGDCILVQVTKDAVKTKNAVVRSDISHFHTHGRISELKNLASHSTACVLLEKGMDITEQILTDTGLIKGKHIADEIQTDNEYICDCIRKNAADNKIPDIPVTYYQDYYPLYKLISLESLLDSLLEKKVWLKSGGNIIIEQLETMTVIDVNSAKSSSKKDFLDINQEAAKEILRQLRLRNISGMILIDFINLKSEEDVEALMTFISLLAKQDRTPLKVIDYTGLGLIELTRAKMHPSVRQIIFNQ